MVIPDIYRVRRILCSQCGPCPHILLSWMTQRTFLLKSASCPAPALFHLLFETQGWEVANRHSHVWQEQYPSSVDVLQPLRSAGPAWLRSDGNSSRCEVVVALYNAHSLFGPCLGLCRDVQSIIICLEIIKDRCTNQDLFGSGISQILIFEIGISIGYSIDICFTKLSMLLAFPMDIPKQLKVVQGFWFPDEHPMLCEVLFNRASGAFSQGPDPYSGCPCRLFPKRYFKNCGDRQPSTKNSTLSESFPTLF